MKKCYLCKAELPILNFSRNKSKKDGYSSACKECDSKISKEYRNKNTDILAKKAKERAEKNKVHIAAYQKEYRERNKKILDLYDRERAKTPERKKRNIENQRKRLKEDRAARVIFRVRNRVGNFLRRQNEKYSKTLGCSKDFFFQYIESLFQPGMTWNNYPDWELDHKIPLSVAYANGPDAFKEACHYTNVQPLWKHDNRVKGNKNGF